MRNLGYFPTEEQVGEQVTSPSFLTTQLLDYRFWALLSEMAFRLDIVTTAGLKTGWYSAPHPILEHCL